MLDTISDGRTFRDIARFVDFTEAEIPSQKKTDSGSYFKNNIQVEPCWVRKLVDTPQIKLTPASTLMNWFVVLLELQPEQKN